MRRLLFFVLIIAITLGTYSCKEETMKYDNHTPYAEKITHIYSSQIFDSVQKEIKNIDYSFNELNSKVKFECVRQVGKESYAVFKQEDGRIVFVFADNNNIIYSVLRFESFFTESDFNFIEIGKTTQDEILTFDANSIVYPISSITVTGHILNDGLMIVQYSRFQKGILLPSPIVSNVQVIKDSDYETYRDDFLVSNTPYILPIDRVNDK